MRIDAKTVFNSIVIAGCLIFVVGAYYAIIKAGMPYQDPTPEMSLNWTISHRVGEVLLALGAVTFAVGAAGCIIERLVLRKK